MQMNFQREKTSNALEWQQAREQCAEATKGISSWIGLKVMPHKSLCRNPIYIRFHLLFCLYVFFVHFTTTYLLNPPSEIPSTFHLKENIWVSKRKDDNAISFQYNKRLSDALQTMALISTWASVCLLIKSYFLPWIAKEKYACGIGTQKSGLYIKTSYFDSSQRKLKVSWQSLFREKLCMMMCSSKRKKYDT